MGSLPRVYGAIPERPGAAVTIGGEDARHLALSLRMRPGERVVVCDGCGREAVCVLESLAAHAVVARAESLLTSAAESGVQVTLCVALAKAEKLEWVLQKGTELGAAAFRPFVSERCVAKPGGDKLERWRRIVREAAAQSGRGALPEVHPVVSLDEVLARTDRKSTRLNSSHT